MPEVFTANAPTAVFEVGSQTVFEYNGIVLNDRSEQECYWVDTAEGFDDPDIRISAEENTQNIGEQPNPGFYGGRTMTLNGHMRAGSYTKLVEMTDALKMAFRNLTEDSLLLRPHADSIAFTHVDMTIECRKSDKLMIARKIDNPAGLFKRSFQVTLRASDPLYVGDTLHSVVIVPSVVSSLGFSFSLSFDMAFDEPMDSDGYPASGGNTGQATNAGNWRAWPVIRFDGYLRDARLINSSLGQELVLAQPVYDGEYIEIDTHPSRSTVLTGTGSNAFSYLDTSSDWLQIAGADEVLNGINNLSLTVSEFGANGEVTVSWRDTRL